MLTCFNRNIVLVLAGLLALGAQTAMAQGKSAPAPERLTISGSSTMAPMIAELARRFQARHAGTTFTVRSGGSGRGVSDTLDGSSQIGMVSRELLPQEKGLFAIAVARDGVAFVVHRENPVSALTRAQALAIFTGTINDWSALRGRAGRIEAVIRSSGGSTEIVSHYLGVPAEALKGVHDISDNNAVMQLIATTRNAIAFISTGAVEHAVEKGVPVKALTLDGRVPGTGAVRDGTWPMSRPLNLVSRRVPTGIAKAFIEYVLSPEAHPVIIEHDYIPYLR
jgi:phosphate transport system substrate-binding protein